MATEDGETEAGQPDAELANFDFETTDDPWRYLNATRLLALPQRQPLIQRWLDLVRGRPPAERDALLSQGREVWFFRLDTARPALRERDEAAEIRTMAVAVAYPARKLTLLAEAVYDPDTGKVAYLVWRFDQAPTAPTTRMEEEKNSHPAANC